MDKQKIAYFAKILLLVIAIVWLVFALLSGAEGSGTFKNIPNALPWIILFVFACIAFRWQILGGILIVLFGIFTIFFFGFIEVIWLLLIISLPIIVLGAVISLLARK